MHSKAHFKSLFKSPKISTVNVKNIFFLNTTLPKEHSQIYFTNFGATKLKIQKLQNIRNLHSKWTGFKTWSRWPVGPAGQLTPPVIETETERWALRAGAGVLKARFGLPWPRWAERRRRAATLRATRRPRPEPVGHWWLWFSSFSEPKPCLTTGFHVEQTLNPWTSSQNFLNRICRPMYQLQYLFKALVLIRNRNREKSCTRLACQAVRVHDLAKIC